MAVKLNPAQRRVLGVLIEKSMTTPGSYPLTLNAIVVGCNQVSCRDPVLSLSEGEVARAVHELQQWQLVDQAPPDRNARANRFMHKVEERWGWGTRERALMAELLLRGPQTLGELRQNGSRMTPLDDVHYVAELLGALAGREPPMVRELPRQPGKTVVRYDHCLYPDEEPREYLVARTGGDMGAADAGSGQAGSLESRVAKLEEEVAALRAILEGRSQPPRPS